MNLPENDYGFVFSNIKKFSLIKIGFDGLNCCFPYELILYIINVFYFEVLKNKCSLNYYNLFKQLRKFLLINKYINQKYSKFFISGINKKFFGVLNIELINIYCEEKKKGINKYKNSFYLENDLYFTYSDNYEVQLKEDDNKYINLYNKILKVNNIKNMCINITKVKNNFGIYKKNNKTFEYDIEIINIKYDLYIFTNKILNEKENEEDNKIFYFNDYLDNDFNEDDFEKWISEDDYFDYEEIKELEEEDIYIFTNIKMKTDLIPNLTFIINEMFKNKYLNYDLIR